VCAAKHHHASGASAVDASSAAAPAVSPSSTVGRLR